MRSARNFFLVFFLLTVMAAFVIFAFQNSQMVEISFLRWKDVPRPLALYIAVSFGLGMLLTFVLVAVSFFRFKQRLRKARRLQESLEKEIDVLRNQTLYDEPSALPSAQATILDRSR
jgi:uncharacterized integral membrane protein